MNDFLNWLNEERNIVFGSLTRDGNVTLYINNIKYVYYVNDNQEIDKINKIRKFSNFKALNYLKKLVNQNDATLIKNKSTKKFDGGEGCPICKTPYPNYVPGIECPGCGLHGSE